MQKVRRSAFYLQAKEEAEKVKTAGIDRRAGRGPQTTTSAHPSQTGVAEKRAMQLEEENKARQVRLKTSYVDPKTSQFCNSNKALPSLPQPTRSRSSPTRRRSSPKKKVVATQPKGGGSGGVRPTTSRSNYNNQEKNKEPLLLKRQVTRSTKASAASSKRRDDDEDSVYEDSLASPLPPPPPPPPPHEDDTYVLQLLSATQTDPSGGGSFYDENVLLAQAQSPTRSPSAEPANLNSTKRPAQLEFGITRGEAIGSFVSTNQTSDGYLSSPLTDLGGSQNTAPSSTTLNAVGSPFAFNSSFPMTLELPKALQAAYNNPLGLDDDEEDDDEYGYEEVEDLPPPQVPDSPACLGIIGGGGGGGGGGGNITRFSPRHLRLDDSSCSPLRDMSRSRSIDQKYSASPIFTPRTRTPESGSLSTYGLEPSPNSKFSLGGGGREIKGNLHPLDLSVDSDAGSCNSHLEPPPPQQHPPGHHQYSRDNHPLQPRMARGQQRIEQLFANAVSAAVNYVHVKKFPPKKGEQCWR